MSLIKKVLSIRVRGKDRKKMVKPNFLHLVMQLKLLKIFGICVLFLGLYSCAQNTKSMQSLSKSIQKSNYYYNLGLAGLSADNYALAISNFEKAILLNQNNYKAYDKLGLAFLDVHDYRQAISNINKAISINPNYYQAILDKAFILYTIHDYNNAIKTLNACINSVFCSLKPQAYYELANIYKTMKNNNKYIENLEQSILYDRKFQQAKFELAKAYVDNKMCHYKQIENKVQNLLKNQTTPDIILLKAKCYIQAKQFNKASKLIQQLLFNDNVSQEYKEQAVNLSKDLIISKYRN